MNKFIDIASEVIESSGKIALNLLMPVAGPIINEAFDIPSRLSQKRKVLLHNSPHVKFEIACK